MELSQIMEKLDEIFQDVFDDPDIHLTEETTAADIEGWDSLMNINIIVSVEDEFDMKFAMEEITGIKNVGEMAKVIQQRIA